MKQVSWIIVASLVSITGCSEMTTRQEQAASSASTFLEDRAFLEEHTDVVVLGNDPDGPQVIVAPAWQGRVMTSTADAATGMGYGWLNKSLIASGRTCRVKKGSFSNALISDANAKSPPDS